MSTYTEAANTFLEAADWLTALDEPMITGLKHLAEELDKGFAATTYAQFGLTFRYLAKQKPVGTVEVDEDEDLTEL
jgi:hypothetical protein